MNLKKVIAIGTALMMSTVALVGCSNKDKGTENKKLKVTMITSVGGVNDQSFNQACWEGLQKAQEKLGIQAGYLESNQESDYISNIETAIDEGNDLIVGVGYQLKDAILSAAKDYPDQKFAVVDSDYGDETPDNVTCLTFSEEQSGYVVGLVAGKMTKTNKVGFVGGLDNVVIKRFEAGYTAGVKEANPNATVQVQYANTFVDAAKGKSIAQQMFTSGVDVIFAAAGDTGNGVIEVAKEKNLYAIGVDRDQNNLAPKNVITSAMKKVDEGIYKVVDNLVNGKFDGGQVLVYGLKENAVGIAPSTKDNVSVEIIDFVNGKVQDVISGKIVVPKK